MLRRRHIVAGSRRDWVATFLYGILLVMIGFMLLAKYEGWRMASDVSSAQDNASVESAGSEVYGKLASLYRTVYSAKVLSEAALQESMSSLDITLGYFKTSDILRSADVINDVVEGCGGIDIVDFQASLVRKISNTFVVDVRGNIFCRKQDEKFAFAARDIVTRNDDLWHVEQVVELADRGSE